MAVITIPHEAGTAGETRPDHRTLARRLVRGREADPAYVRPSLWALLTATAVTYLWGLGASGWANSFYSAAVQAGATSWKAMFFGSFDSSNAITVDKPPAALWIMEISARIFGVNAWSILVPEALMGVATAYVVFVCVRRWFHPAAGLLAGAVMAMTPVAALMFRFNNPDALLVLLLSLGAYAVMRAVEGEHAARWAALAGVFVGFGFLAKMMQAFVVLPVFGLVYLIAGAVTLRKRIAHLVLMGLTTIAAAGWWVAIVELWPKSSRPYIGGSQTNSVIDLIFGYNGLGRLTGNETGSTAGGNGGNWGPTGWLRLFNSQFGGEASWLIPAALVLAVAGLAFTIRTPRTDRTRAGLLLWGGSLFLTGAVISLSKGIIHPYYTVALAPSIGATIGIGGYTLWQRRSSLLARVPLAGAVGVTTWWAYELLHRTPSWNTGLRTAIAVTGAMAAVAILALPLFRHRIATYAIAGAAVFVSLAGPTAYSIATASQPHSGSLPSSGPAGAARMGGMGGPGGGNGGPSANAGARASANGGQPPTGQAATALGRPPSGMTGTGGAARTGGVGGLLSASTPSDELVAALQDNASQYTWVLAVVGANQAAGYQLASDEAVLAIGGFNGSDPSPTLAEFQVLVTNGEIHYYIAGGGFGPAQGAEGTSSQILSWVQANFKTVTIDGTTLYDLTSALSTNG
ncbi:MAG: ArnT family glycosyltransferase [Acidimicrobiia bacterium]